MKKIIFFIISFLIAELTSIAKTINLHSGEWTPLSSEKLKFGGLGPRIIKETFSLEGLNSIRKCKNNLAVQNSKQICA
ncbi:MAG: hypothetical protein AB8G05_17555 [Oligoflexales bacterium]